MLSTDKTKNKSGMGLCGTYAFTTFVTGASLLLAYGVPMKRIKEWLGHSDFSTTANIYSHLDYTAKLHTAETLVVSLDFAPKKPP